MKLLLVALLLIAGRSFAVRLLIAAVLLLTGCGTAPVQLDHSVRLLSRPDFPAAAASAPEWCRDALKTINQLEAQLERK